MLINVFGKWINPDHVVCLRETELNKDGKLVSAVKVVLVDDRYIVLLDKIMEEVAKEINKSFVTHVYDTKYVRGDYKNIMPCGNVEWQKV